MPFGAVSRLVPNPAEIVAFYALSSHGKDALLNGGLFPEDDLI